MTADARKRLFDNIATPLLAVLCGLIVSAIPILLTNKNPLAAYAVLFKSGFSFTSLKSANLLVTFQLATPLILTGLSAVVAFRTGLFSLGMEGQLLLGGMTAAWLGYAVQLPPFIHPVFAICAAMTVGGLYSWLPGMLRVRLGVNEIISTIVLNNIARLFVLYLINYPLRADPSTTAYSPMIRATARLPAFVPGSKWGVGFILALLAAIFVFLYLWRSASGYEQRMSGEAPLFARFGGIPSGRAAMRGMFVSGALAGLGGAIQALGVHYRMLDGFSAGLGWDGITAAILGQVHPLGVVIVAVFFAGVRQGAQVGLQFAMRIPRELGGIIISLMILFVAADKLYRNGLDRITARKKRSKGLSRGGL
jgi:simple sugar transport system permease protein